MPKTKIICTIGPSSSAEAVLRKMVLAGMDVARLNFSHGLRPEHLQRIHFIRLLNKKYRRRVKILQDLEGYRIRVGEFRDKGGARLEKKQILNLTNERVTGNKATIPFDYEGSLLDIKSGSRIFIDDGNIELKVLKSGKKLLKAEVVIPGIVKENKGMNLPDVSLKFSGLTEKDKEDIDFGVKNGVDFIAQSFVRNKADIVCIRDFIKNSRPDCRIIAKIENRQGISNIDEIIKASDGIMIARGDMGVSLPIYEIPIIQKQIIKKCNQARKPVITATQMLESMTEHVRPTRAEVTDVANAVLDGTDYVMLSGETAAGKHPVETVKMMNEIIKFTEANSEYS